MQIRPAGLGPPSRRERGQRGQSLVELALVLPVFLLIVMATVDFGWALRSYITATNSAREGARLGVTGASEAAIEQRVFDTGESVFSNFDHRIAVDRGDGNPGANVTVSVDFDYAFITPLGKLLDLAGGSETLTISTETVMRLE